MVFRSLLKYYSNFISTICSMKWASIKIDRAIWMSQRDTHIHQQRLGPNEISVGFVQKSNSSKLHSEWNGKKSEFMIQIFNFFSSETG